VATAEILADILRANDAKGGMSASSMVISDEDRHLKLYEDLVKGAFEVGASDLHFEVNLRGSDRSDVKVRLYGRLRHWKTFETGVLHNAVAAAFNAKSKKGTASGPSWSADRSLSTMTEHKINATKVNGRFSTYPVITGVDVVVRLLESDPGAVKVLSMDELGYAPSQIQRQLRPALMRNAGLFAVSGSTGSGKSTSLKTFMNELPNIEELKRFSVEDPVEYIMPGVRQISIQRGADEDDASVKKKFLSALRMLVRMDPDVVMIGEIRDRESGEIASEMVQTGHRVLTTVHGDGAIDVLSRLTGRGIAMPPEILATRRFLTGVMYQKLMPVVCQHCRVPAKRVLDKETLTVIQDRFLVNTDGMYCADVDGCDKCKVAGIESYGRKGLTVAAEIVLPNAELLQHIGQRDWYAAEKVWRGTRNRGFGDPDMTGKTAFEHALYKSSIGIVDPRDIEKDFESFHSYEIYAQGGAQ
jgi:type II secretory ATPase GspE/PulE/Tfp pilus assembly ATPase PilB-like protein